MSKLQLNDLEFRASDIGRNKGKSLILLSGQIWWGLRQKMSRLVGYKFTLVMEETKSRTVSPISVNFW